MKLTFKSQRTLDSLISKADLQCTESIRMPTISAIDELLSELNIPHTYDGTSCTKTTKSSGMRYTTGGGTKIYNGHKLRFELDNRFVNMDSTDSYYSWNTGHYASNLLKLIHKNK